MVTAMTTQRKVDAIGETVEGDDEIEQSLRLLLTVRKNAIPHRPDLGGKLFELIDAPLSVAKAKAFVLVQQAAKADPRITVIATSVTRTDTSSLTLEVRWHPTATPTTVRSTTITVS
jgi:phage baseplate assembly protein W